jgi:hypothetical protein
MNLLGSIISADAIIGISPMYRNKTLNPDTLQYSFNLITTSGMVEFRSSMIEDPHIATAEEKKELYAFELEYNRARDIVADHLNEQNEDFEYRVYKIDRAFEGAGELHIELEKLLMASKSKAKDQLLRTLRNMRPHIISLKQLAEL